MPKRASRMRLERRGRLIFGTFILLTVVGCLWWPWWQIGRLAQSGDIDRAQAIARAALQNYHAIKLVAAVGNTASTDKAARQLTENATKQLRDFGIVKGEEKQPRVIGIDPAEPGKPQAPPKDTTLTPVEAEAVAAFLAPQQRKAYGPPFRRTDGDTFHYIQPLPAEEECLACHKVKYSAGDLLGIVSLDLDVSQRQTMLLYNRIVLVAAAILVVLLSMAVFYAVFRYMVVRPIHHLKDVADRVSEGDLGVRSEIDAGNELEDLSDALNHMLDEMAKAQSDLRAATEFRDAKLDELAKANVALFETNQVKNKFLATMSHELRTPLNSILGFTQILSDSPAIAGDPKLARYARNILSSGRMLLEMINDLLDLAKIEAGRLQVRCEKVSPHDIVETVANMVRPLLAETPLKFTALVDPATPIMATDPTKVQQILYNLLSNAIKFTSEGEVGLIVRPVASQPDSGRFDQVALAVMDTGPGIARDEQLRIFERFTQLDSSYTRRYRGTGLGLSIVKELTGLLGGTVSVESEVGHGSTFTVVLPVDSSLAEGRAALNGNGAAPTESAGLDAAGQV
jgi:signal transduction histidine kinase